MQVSDLNNLLVANASTTNVTAMKFYVHLNNNDGLVILSAYVTAFEFFATIGGECAVDQRLLPSAVHGRQYRFARIAMAWVPPCARAVPPSNTIQIASASSARNE